jgi:hypothetical protein
VVVLAAGAVHLFLVPLDAVWLATLERLGVLDGGQAP